MKRYTRGDRAETIGLTLEGAARTLTKDSDPCVLGLNFRDSQLCCESFRETTRKHTPCAMFSGGTPSPGR